jgi:CTP synthase
MEAEDLEKGKIANTLGGMDGILVPGGFGVRGIEGKIKAITFAREKKIPYFGICLGMQCAAIEFARNVASLHGANSTEFDLKTPHKILFLWRELKKDHDLGGTMRLGQFLCHLEKNSFAYQAYKKSNIYERHRHRYEFNPEYEKILADKGLFFSGKNPEYNLVEIIEIKNHPWFLGCQFHPEFKSRPLEPHPLFKAFIGASYAHRLKRNRNKQKS